MLTDLFSDWSHHLRALASNPLVWAREHWTFLLLVLTSAAALLWWISGILTTDEGRFCPGPRPAGLLHWRRILAALWPINWVSHWSALARCGYDLSRTPRTHLTQQICPECGTRSTSSSQIPGTLSLSLSLRRPHAGMRRFRPIRLTSTHRPRVFRRDVVAGLILLACLSLWKSPTYRYATYLDHAPDRLIIVAAGLLGPISPDALESRLHQRLSDPALSSADAVSALPALVARLSNDARSWNSVNASASLQTLLDSPDPLISTNTDAALEDALSHPDRQTRQMAASILRHHIESRPHITPSRALLIATIEGLDADDLNERTEWLANAREGVAFLCRHAHLATPLLAHKLSDQDPQGRWLAAVIVARSNLIDLMPQAAPILIQQLHDNDTWGDERVAADALRHFGPAIIPLLTPHFDSQDPQLRTWCGRLVRELREGEQGITPAPILPNRRMLIYTPGVAMNSSAP